MPGDAFADALENSFRGLEFQFKAGSKVTGRVAAIDRKSVFIDLNSKSEGVVDRQELLDAEGNLTVAEGDTLDAFVLDTAHGELRLTTRMTGKAAAAMLEDAYSAGIPVDGKVVGENKGGYDVKVGGRMGFCPFSQMDARPAASAAAHIGKVYPFIITRIAGGEIVLSRRKLLDEQRRKAAAKLRETLAEGDVVEGVVSSVKDFGAFVDLGGQDGFIPASEFTWSRSGAPSDHVAPGQTVRVAVKKIDWEANRVTLSFRSAATPFPEICARFAPGTVVEGVVTRLAPFGAFIEIEKGVEGLAHISRIAPGRRLKNPAEVLAVGDKVAVAVESVDPEAERISLTFDVARAAAPAGADAAPDQAGGAPPPPIPDGPPAIAVGSRLAATVDAVKEFGVFMRLPGGRSGLLHISAAAGESGRRLSPGDLRARFKIGAEVAVRVADIRPDGKISLSLPGAGDEEDRPAPAPSPPGGRPRSASGMGSLSDAFASVGL